MTHHHKHHHEHHHAISSLNSIFIACIVINLAFVFIEAGVGFIYNSLGLLSDAGHNLSDVFSLLLSLFAFRMSQYHSNRHFTYGYKKSTVLVSLVNAIILLIAVGAIVIESFYKLKHPEATSGEAISWTAGIGILVNGITAWLLMKNQNMIERAWCPGYGYGHTEHLWYNKYRGIIIIYTGLQSSATSNRSAPPPLFAPAMQPNKSFFCRHRKHLHKTIRTNLLLKAVI